MAHLTSVDEFLHRAGDVLDRHIRIDAVLVQKVDVIGAQPLQHRIRHAFDMIGVTVRPRVTIHSSGPDIEAKLGGDNHFVAYRCEGFTDQFLVGPRTVDLGGIEKRYAQFMRAANDADGFRRDQELLQKYR